MGIDDAICQGWESGVRVKGRESGLGTKRRVQVSGIGDAGGGRRPAMGVDAAARVWDMRTKAQIHVLGGHGNTVEDILCQADEP